VDDLTRAASQILGVTNRVQFKEGLCFQSSPIFQELLKDPNKQLHDPSYSSGGMMPHISKDDLKEQVEDIEDEKKEEKEKRKKKRDPSVKEVREHLRTIIQYHEKQVEKSIPSIYPLLGACGSDDDDGGDSGKSSQGRIFKAAASEPSKKAQRKKRAVNGTPKKKK
jgi:hypothetical protein